MNNKKVVALIIVATFILAYILGFSQGQYSVYKKVTDGTSLEQVYKMK